MRIRNFEENDLQTIASLLNKEYGDDQEFVPFTTDRVRSQVSGHGLKIKVAEESGRVTGLVATHPEGTCEESIHWLAADEDSNERPTEDALVRYVEEHSDAESISTMIADGSPKIKRWEKRSYFLCPGFQRLTAKLDTLRPIPELSEGTTLRSLRPDEEEKLVELVNSGFGWERLEKGTINEWKSDDPLFTEEWIHVAEVGGRLVSTVVSKRDVDYLKYFKVQRGYLGPAATLSEYRNKHIAKALTARAMNFLLDKGMTSVRLGTAEKNVSSQALLRSLGFQIDSTRKILRKKLAKTSEPPVSSVASPRQKSC